MAMEGTYKHQSKAKGHKKARRHHRGGQKVRGPPPRLNFLLLLLLHHLLPLRRPLAPATSWTANINATAQGSPGVEPDLLSRLVQVSQSEAELLVRFPGKIREGSACEDFVENPLVEDEPGQESTQGPC
ncbi:hypothetical protein PENNAL_c0006G04710 [Penicillium nalgiovense]|uniref:Uncharacterized protein n=1 Tax=Penicillium nalgiovense TaxID=60175 RepID=A0A1V6Z0D5_PENNA|nr:hypothetical protein PENNAL_c0006G04710 [Penicillium nalgiovense]